MCDQPTKNGPNYAFMAIDEQKQQYYEDTLGKFVDKYIISDDETDNPQASAADNNPRPVDHLRYYSRNILQYFFVLEDYCDAVRERDGKRMAEIRKDFLLFFKMDWSFNAYAIEMMVKISQNEVLLSEQETHHAIWCQTVK